MMPSARFPKFVIQGSILLNEFRKAKGTSKSMIPVRLFDLKFLIELAAGGAGTSNRRHQALFGRRSPAGAGDGIARCCYLRRSGAMGGYSRAVCPGVESTRTGHNQGRH
jgi:hypothetical protein